MMALQHRPRVLCTRRMSRSPALRRLPWRCSQQLAPVLSAWLLCIICRLSAKAAASVCAPQSASSAFMPLRLLALRCSPRRADLVAAVGETTGTAALSSMLARMQSSPTGRQILTEQPRITARHWWTPCSGSAFL